MFVYVCGRLHEVEHWQGRHKRRKRPRDSALPQNESESARSERWPEMKAPASESVKHSHCTCRFIQTHFPSAHAQSKRTGTLNVFLNKTALDTLLQTSESCKPVCIAAVCTDQAWEQLRTKNCCSNRKHACRSRPNNLPTPKSMSTSSPVTRNQTTVI
jgi:hypothetical protein